MNESSKNIIPDNQSFPSITAHGSLVPKNAIITGVYVFHTAKTVVYACIDGSRLVSIDCHGEVRVKGNIYAVPATLKYSDYQLWEVAKSGGVSLTLMFGYKEVVDHYKVLNGGVMSGSDKAGMAIFGIFLLLVVIGSIMSFVSLLYFFRRVYTGLAGGKKWYDAL